MRVPRWGQLSQNIDKDVVQGISTLLDGIDSIASIFKKANNGVKENEVVLHDRQEMIPQYNASTTYVMATLIIRDFGSINCNWWQISRS